MPYVHISIAKKLSDEQKGEITSKLGKLIEIIPGKVEQGLMIRLDDDLHMTYRGVLEDCAYVNIYLFLHSLDPKKGEFGQALVAMLGEVAGILPNNIVINFTEYGNWFSANTFK